LFGLYYYNYPQYYLSTPGFGYLWGLPFLFSRGPEINVNVNSYIVKREVVEREIEPSSQMRDNLEYVQMLSDALNDELSRKPVDKALAIELYSEIRDVSQEIADESFYDYLEIVDTLPRDESYADGLFEIPDDLSLRMMIKAREVRIMTHHLNTELRKRPVDKIKALDLYFDIRAGAQEIADERFFDYLDSLP
jgi:DNA-directed RNA polymerase specialized sigma subunit